MREETSTPTCALNFTLIGRFNTNVFWISYAQFQTPEFLELNEGFSITPRKSLYMKPLMLLEVSVHFPKTSLSYRFISMIPCKMFCVSLSTTFFFSQKKNMQNEYGLFFVKKMMQ